MGIATINPATREVLKTFTALTTNEIDAKLAIAHDCFQHYRYTSFADRTRWILQAADILERDQASLAQMMTTEMGKPINSAIAEIKKCALVCRFYAEKAETFLADETVTTDASHSYIHYQPLGVILAVMPWNFPFWQVFRFAAPALMAGNVGVLKHASNVPQCALAIAEIMTEAGFPEGAFQTLLISASQVEQVINDDRVKAATLTGSEPAGASLAAAAGHQIKKTVLELGGSDPFIVMPSADLEAAIDTAVTARMLNNGQSCIAAKRFILHEAIAESFEKALFNKFQALIVGDPMAEATDIGPLATESILSDLERQVQTVIAAGGQALLGGKPLDQPGNYYPPTILKEIPTNAAIAKEEFFGPVALLFSVNNIDEAITLANDIPFGLGSSAWTQEATEQQRFIQDIDAGAVFINGMVKSDPRISFGGIKRSGYGRELGQLGIQEFVNAKTVWVK